MTPSVTGGGYSYRLCKADTGTNVTEECFQRGHLDFAGEVSWLQLNESKLSRVQIPRVTVSSGTVPKGSMWARNPIPACYQTGKDMGWDVCANTGEMMRITRTPTLHSYTALIHCIDCAGCCATVPLPAHVRINESWWRTQDCIAGCAWSGHEGRCVPLVLPLVLVPSVASLVVAEVIVHPTYTTTTIIHPYIHN
jgi:hypothetical protein